MRRLKERYRKFIFDCFRDGDYIPLIDISQKADEFFKQEMLKNEIWPIVDEMVSEGILKRVHRGPGIQRV